MAYTAQGVKPLSVTPAHAFRLIASYIRRCLTEQIRAIWLIVAYLVVFQTFVLGIPIAHAARVSAGLSVVVIGLALFFEGLLLGLMPLGESIGLRLPRRAGTLAIVAFAFVLGVGATFAEPAIGVLRAAGRTVKPWDAPLLYMTLGRNADKLYWAIALGVGCAVVFGMLRFLWRRSLKPFIYISVFFTIGLSVLANADPRVRALIGLAWDCGGVTTGPVTVPLVLALGIGISRVVGRSGTASGFGVVTLASLLPVASVLAFGLILAPQAPMPMDKEAFLSPERHDEALTIVGSEQAFARYAEQTLETLPPFDLGRLAVSAAVTSVRAVGPLVALLLLVLFLLRERLRRPDEAAFGIALALAGMALFTAGIELGLAPMGGQAGKYLPAAFKPVAVSEQARTIALPDTSLVQSAVGPDGVLERFFFTRTASGFEAVKFEKAAYDSLNHQYTVVPVRGPLFNRQWGLVLVLLFAFVLGYGATLAEPALNALGRTVEEVTVGAMGRSELVHTVALGVGFGMVLGAVKVVWDVPILTLLVPLYALAVILTVFSHDDFVNIAWDSAGVTTGPITVPLVIALGLGVGEQMGVVEGFGILATASVGPVLSVLLTSLLGARRSRLDSADDAAAEGTIS